MQHVYGLDGSTNGCYFHIYMYVCDYYIFLCSICKKVKY